MKPIRLSAHARDSLIYGGATEDEIAHAIRTAMWGTAERGRLECREDRPYNQGWNGRT